MLYQFTCWDKIYDFAYTQKLYETKYWLLDLDDTLITSKSYKGSSSWFYDEFKKVETYKEKKELINKWNSLQSKMKYRLCNKHLILFLKKIDGKASLITARGRSVIWETYMHLHQTHINDMLYDNIYFCGSVKKSTVLKKKFKDIIDNQNSYVFIDDNLSNVLEMEENFPEMICIYYKKKREYLPLHRKISNKLYGCFYNSLLYYVLWRTRNMDTDDKYITNTKKDSDSDTDSISSDDGDIDTDTDIETDISLYTN